MPGFQKENGLIERVYWLIRLRWLALAGVISAILSTKLIAGIQLPFRALYFIVLALAIYNLLFYLYLKLARKRLFSDSGVIVTRVTNIQISMDLVFLAGLIHFSGGIENPFIFYFIFHMIITSTLLSRRESFIQATFAVFLFMLIVWLEYAGFLEHHCLRGFVLDDLHANRIYIFGVSFVFISTLYLAAYMASSISIRLKDREKSLKEANLLLEEKDRIKSEYVLRVSHDIKEHLAAVQSCVEPVARGITGALNNAQKDLLDRAVERTNKLLFFVKALLEITRIKLSKDISMEYFSLKKTVDSAIALVEEKARVKGMEIALRMDPGVDMIYGAEIYIEETIANLLANAVKYTSENGKISLDIKDRQETLLIQISDTGMGIPRDEISKLFNEFYRATNAKKTVREGTGLGLAIARQVVERHKGKIWVESEEGRGSTFSISLPK
ncbi:MAG: HAMP domain-containing sensor histidine kinase [Candidatus Omnitrophota bacterium]|nr:HAMP domain-containing sensor histidine kinase [Candidatus Omnitrophota bacterium]